MMYIHFPYSLPNLSNTAWHVIAQAFSYVIPKRTLHSRTTFSGHAKRNYFSVKGRRRERRERERERKRERERERGGEKRESLGFVIYALLDVYLQPGTTEAGESIFPRFLFAPLTTQEPRPTLRMHARHALRLGRSISANGDYIF